MRRVLITAIAAAAVALATQASAAPTVSDTTGTPLANQIFGIANVGTTNFGSSPNNDGTPNVRFTCNSSCSMGAGFAQINDATPNTPDLYDLIINPTATNFTDFKWSVQLTGSGIVVVYYLLAGTGLDQNNILSYTLQAGSYNADGSNLNKLLSGASFDSFAIRTTAPIAFFEIKQLSYNPTGSPAVPEPATWGLMLLGFGGIGMALRRRRRRETGATLMQIA
jgi:hypothetical protein